MAMSFKEVSDIIFGDAVDSYSDFIKKCDEILDYYNIGSMELISAEEMYEHFGTVCGIYFNGEFVYFLSKEDYEKYVIEI